MTVTDVRIVNCDSSPSVCSAVPDDVKPYGWIIRTYIIHLKHVFHTGKEITLDGAPQKHKYFGTVKVSSRKNFLRLASL